jgi:hypothetical protein
MATAYAFAKQSGKAAAIRAILRQAQVSRRFGDGNGIVAASHDAASTGFGFKLFRRLHVGATCWLVFAMLRFNPYDQTRA